MGFLVMNKKEIWMEVEDAIISIRWIIYQSPSQWCIRLAGYLDLTERIGKEGTGNFPMLDY